MSCSPMQDLDSETTIPHTSNSVHVTTMALYLWGILVVSNLDSSDTLHLATQAGLAVQNLWGAHCALHAG